MYAISLTSVPPRFARLRPVLENLLAQSPAPAQVLLCLPHRYRRFPGTVHPPDLPKGVNLIRAEHDLGPATKILPAARTLRGSFDRLIYCDDDWLMPPDWAAKLMTAQRGGEAVTGSGFNVCRLDRQSTTATGMVDIAQGFSGVLIDPAWLTDDDLDPPEAAWPVDDVWLSGQLTRQGVPIRVAADASKNMRLAYEDQSGLQNTVISGRSRNAANRACADLLHQSFGIWPPLT